MSTDARFFSREPGMVRDRGEGEGDRESKRAFVRRGASGQDSTS